MADITECPVCFEEYVEPKFLPCTHTLCLNCLESLQKSDKKGRHIRCPLCNTKHKVPDRGVKAFVENQHVMQLILYQEKMKDMEKLLKAGPRRNGREKEVDNLNYEEQLAAVSLQETNKNAENSSGSTLRKQDSSAVKQKENTSEDEPKASPQHSATADVRPKVKVRPKVNTQPGVDANLVTFSRQKLALLQCEYNTKCCSHCGKRASVEELKQCMKCKTAKYCSRECQTKDWKSKHKKHCRELERLQKTIALNEEGSNQNEEEHSKETSVFDLSSQKADWKKLNRVKKRKDGRLSMNIAVITEHDRHCCQHCGKSSLLVELEACSNCKVSQYCSRECRAKDWKARHKMACEQVKQMKAMSLKAGEQSKTRLIPKQQGKSWSLDPDVLVHKIHAHDDQIIMIGDTRRSLYTKSTGICKYVIAVYDASTGSKKQEVRRQERENFSRSVCTVRTDKSCCIAVSSGTRENSRIDLWPLSLTPPEPGMALEVI